MTIYRCEMRMNKRHRKSERMRKTEREEKRFMIYDHGSHLMGFYASSSLTFPPFFFACLYILHPSYH